MYDGSKHLVGLFIQGNVFIFLLVFCTFSFLFITPPVLSQLLVMLKTSKLKNEVLQYSDNPSEKLGS